MYNAIGLAQAADERKGDDYQTTPFFKLQDGETRVLRFLTALVPSKRIKCSQCGLIDTISTYRWEQNKAAGNPVKCSNCSNEITEKDVIEEPRFVEGAMEHAFVPTGDGNRANFICLNHEDNKQMGLTDGKYPCPICAEAEARGKKPSISRKLYGVAIEREVTYESSVGANGMKQTTITGVKDKTDVNDEGKTVPKIYIVSMSWGNFWKTLNNYFPNNEGNIMDYDWSITRTGGGLETKYLINKVNNQPSLIENIDKYEPLIPDIRKMLLSRANPEYYHKKGKTPLGYTPETDNTQPQENNFAQTPPESIQTNNNNNNNNFTSWDCVSN